MPDGLTISIATITRNDLAGLRRTIASVLEQTYPQIQYLIVDGASDDGTPAYLQEIAATSNRVQWLSESDRGIADAFNKAHRLALGESLLFMNSGDVFVSPQTVEEAVSKFPSSTAVESSIIYGDYYLRVGTTEYFVRSDHQRLTQTNSLNHQSTFVGRHIYQNHHYDDRLFLGMDYDYWLRGLSRGVPFVKIDLPIARFDASGVSSARGNGVHREAIRFFLRSVNLHRKITVWALLKFLGGSILPYLRYLLQRLLGNQRFQSIKRSKERIFGAQAPGQREQNQ